MYIAEIAVLEALLWNGIHSISQSKYLVLQNICLNFLEIANIVLTIFIIIISRGMEGKHISNYSIQKHGMLIQGILPLETRNSIK